MQPKHASLREMTRIATAGIIVANQDYVIATSLRLQAAA